MATFSFDFGNILTQSTLDQEEEDLQAVPTQFDFSSSFSPVDDVELEDISVARRSYGVAQEPMILGSAYRMGAAGVESLFSDKSFSDY